MFTDMVGYTHLSQANESLALELLEEHRGLLRPAFVAHGGTEVKTMGDAFLVEFKSALEAVLCSVEMQKILEERNMQIDPSRRLQLRIGIHIGDVIREHGDIYGDAVNLASRIEPLAEPGGVCVSQQVYDQIRNRTDLDIEKMGAVELRHVDLPVAVYRINLSGKGRRATYSPAGRERLAVLPFVNISPDPNDEYFSDGLTEEMITKLSELRNLKVISRTSVMSYKRKDKKASEIARELDVGSIVEGSVRKAGNRLRISVQLIDPVTEEHLWSANYDSELNDIFSIQSEVASKVAASLSSGFFARSAHEDTSDVEAYTMYLRAMQLFNQTTEASMKEAVNLLELAVSRDPNFARAYAGLSRVWGLLGATGYEEYTTAAQRAEAAAQRALELGPELAESHAAKANVDFMLDRFRSSLSEAEKAIRINPNLSDVYVSLGILYSILRTPSEALQQFKKAYELDPLSMGVGGILAIAASVAGETSLAWEVLQRMKTLNPGFARTYVNIADFYMDAGDFAEAQRALDTAYQIDSHDSIVSQDQGILYARSGKRKEAEAILDEKLADDKESVRLYGQFMINTALGNLDEAFAALFRQGELHSWPFEIRFDSFYSELRKDPRYAEFCKKVGIPVS